MGIAAFLSQPNGLTWQSSHVSVTCDMDEHNAFLIFSLN